MNSKDIESASDQTKDEFGLQLPADSLQTSKQLCSTQLIKGSYLSHKESDVNQMSSLDNEAKSETKIYMECEVNNSIIAAPKGLFEDKEIRNGFIRKVYGILFVQISFTIIISGIMFTFFQNQLNFKRISERNDGLALVIVIILVIASFIATITVIIIFCCSVSARRTVPTNYILLGIFTIGETFLVGLTCVQDNGVNIIIAFIITGVVVLSITLLATTPWFDITNCGCLLFILLIIHLVMGLVVMVVVIAFDINAKPLYLILSVLGAFLFSLYLLYDTQLILGGKKYEMSPEEYVFAAICLYIDIIQIFLNILNATQIANS